jgi:hypothetical protein
MAEMKSSWPAANTADAEQSKSLLDRVLNRTEALRARTGCTDSGTASVDDLGPLPPSDPCVGQGGQPSTEGGTSGPQGTTTDGTTGQSPSNSTSPETSTNGGTSTGNPSDEKKGLLPPLLGSDPARSQSGEPTSSSGSSGTSTSSEDSDKLLPPITLPPLLPGLGPVTIG